MNEIEKKLDTAGKHFFKNGSLDDSEKLHMTQFLQSYIEKNPISPEAERKIEALRLQKSRFTFNKSINLKTHMIISIIVALLLGGSVSYAAEGALPGDTLYPIKINVNENVRSTLALSTEAEAKLAANLAEERIEEVEKLAIEGRLTNDLQSKLNAEFTAHAKHTQASIAELSVEGDHEEAAEIASDVESSTEAHVDILSSLLVSHPRFLTELSAMLETVRGSAYAAAEARGNMEVNVATNADASVEEDTEKARAKAKLMIEKIEEKISDLDDKLSAEAKAEAKMRAGGALEVFASGEAKFTAKAYGEAMRNFKEAIRRAESTQMYMHAMSEFSLKLPVLDVPLRNDTRIHSTTSANIELMENSNIEDGDDRVENNTEIKSESEVQIKSPVNINTNIQGSTGVKLGL